MVQLRISNRLQTVINQLPAGCVIADIGTDHAYLPIAAVQQGIASRVIAGDVRNGPWQAAMQHIQLAGLSECIDVRLGDGLDVLQVGEVDAITICGMGGSLMTELLDKGRSTNKLEGVRRLVLQPNVGEGGLRTWLRRNGWFVSAEQWLEEDGFVYPILTADRISQMLNDELVSIHEGNSRWPVDPPGWVREHVMTTEWLDLLGGWNLIHPSVAWCAKWSRELEQMNAILQSLEQARSDEAVERRKKLELDASILREVLLWWQPQAQ